MTTDKHIIDPIDGQIYFHKHWHMMPESVKENVRYHVRVSAEMKRTVHLDARRLEVQFQGHLVKCSLRGGVPRPAPAKRGTIHEFSAQSRGRLLEKFARLKKPARTSMVTLTYGAMFPSPDRAKENLRAFLERLRRREDCKKTSGFWRIENQKRGAPHFHFVAFNLPYIPKKEISKMWREIVKGHGKPTVRAVRKYRKFSNQTAAMRYPFTRIEAIRSWNGIMHYASKYIAKKQEDYRAGINGFNYLSYLHGLGRVWGVFQKQNLPFAPLKVIHWPFIARAFTKFRKCAEALWPALVEQEAPGFKLYVLNAMQWVKIWDDCAEITF